jgi:hypothetical protein
MITDEQKQGQLHPDFFCPDQYFAWAKKTGVDFPKPIYEGVHKFLRDANSRANETQSLLDSTGADPSGATNPKARGGAGKLKSSATEIILAFLMRHGGYRPSDPGLDSAKTKVRNLDLKRLAGDLSSILNNLEADATLKGDKHPVSARTIQGHLTKAIDLLK